MRFRAIALDLDGTALNSRGDLSASLIAGLDRARARGAEVILVTGRHHLAALPYYRRLNLTSPLICCNGAYVYDPHMRRTISGRPFDKTQAAALLTLMRARDIHIMIYSDAAMNYETANAHVARLLEWQDALRPPQAILKQVVSFEALLTQAQDIWKFVISPRDPAIMPDLTARLEGDERLHVEQSWVDRLDISRAGLDKGGRLLEWAALRGIKPDEIIAFGDHHNDVSMIKAAGLGCAMGNGVDALKAVADCVIGDHDTDALACALAAHFDAVTPAAL